MSALIALIAMTLIGRLQVGSPVGAGRPRSERPTSTLARRQPVGHPCAPLAWTEEDYGIALAAGLDADVTMVTGCQPTEVVDAQLHRRLVNDLGVNGKVVIADLTGPPLRATLQGGVELLRLSEEMVHYLTEIDHRDHEAIAPGG